MTTQYKMVRVPRKTYDRYIEIQNQMRLDLTKITGKPMKLPLTKVFRAVVDPKINENFIQIDKKMLLKMVRKKK